ncbi:MAG: serine/threonine-protein kinase, partial [Polyangiaceae bacterium]
YEVLRLLGRGEMASVYECRHAKLGRCVAIKVLHPHLARDKSAAARFLREGQALARVEHPNVVEVFDVGEHHSVPYLVMSLVEGEDLEEHFRRHHPMAIAAIADCVLPVIGAVAAAYDAGVVFRDVKPSNIRMARDHRGAPTPKVLDFGISKLTGDERGQKVSHINELLGTASYMAPEELHSAKQASARGDVYALGVILYQAATAARPFHGGDAFELMHAILTARVSPPSFFRPDLPEEFDALILRAIQREPSQRYDSARELGLALAQFSSDPAAWRAEFLPRSGERFTAAPFANADLPKRSWR